MAKGQYSDSLGGMATWIQYAAGAESLLLAIQEEDQEDTLMLQLTLPEFAACSLGCKLLSLMAPEFGSFLARLGLKFKEVTEAQEFFEPDED